LPFTRLIKVLALRAIYAAVQSVVKSSKSLRTTRLAFACAIVVVGAVCG
jgi:hypothetical protein